MPTTRKTRRRPLRRIGCAPPGWYNPRVEIGRSIKPFATSTAGGALFRPAQPTRSRRMGPSAPKRHRSRDARRDSTVRANDARGVAADRQTAGALAPVRRDACAEPADTDDPKNAPQAAPADRLRSARLVQPTTGDRAIHHARRDRHGRRRVLPAGAAHALAQNGRQRAERHRRTRAATARFAAHRAVTASRSAFRPPARRAPPTDARRDRTVRHEPC